MDLEPINYLTSLFERREVQVALSNGSTLTLQRAGLGRHHRLQAVAQEVGTVALEERVDRLRTWLEAAGVNVDELALKDVPVVTRAVRGLNAPRGRLAWDVHRLDDRVDDVKPTDYAGRPLARIVDLLARHYGWSLEEIINLPPEVALAHSQECVLTDRRQREWEHYLSEMAWEYDRGSGKRHYQPLPPLLWETAPTARKYQPVPQWVKDRYYPRGVVIDLTQSRRDLQLASSGGDGVD